MAALTRYRSEGDLHCIDVRLSSVDQVFDLRDPAPFRERDLEPDLVEYLYTAAEDLAAHGPFQVVLWLPEAVDADRLVLAYRAHFAYEVDRVVRRRRRLKRDGGLALLFAAPLLVALLALARVAGGIARVGVEVSEGITIAGWVLMWRPIETLFYDWIPLRREHKLYTRLRDCPLTVREGTPPRSA